MDAVRIDIACNDPDNGDFAGRAEMIEVVNGVLELEARRHPAPRFVELPSAIRLAGKQWPVLGSIDWIGNWCWNGYWMDPEVAAEFIVWLHRRKLFTRDCGASGLFDVWIYDEPLTPSWVAQFLEPGPMVAR